MSHSLVSSLKTTFTWIPNSCIRSFWLLCESHFHISSIFCFHMSVSRYVSYIFVFHMNNKFLCYSKTWFMWSVHSCICGFCVSHEYPIHVSADFGYCKSLIFTCLIFSSFICAKTETHVSVSVWVLQFCVSYDLQIHVFVRKMIYVICKFLCRYET